jgi:CBS-domain-containing membrane protein
VRARDVMTSSVITAQPSTLIKDAAALLVAHQINAVPVVDEAGCLVGIVSEADLLGLESGFDPRRHVIPLGNGNSGRTDAPRTVVEIMTRDVVALPDDADVADVARLMLDKRIKQIPIVSGNELVGIVSRRDILKVLARHDADIHVELEDLLDEEIKSIGRFRAVVAGGVVTLRGPSDGDSRRLAELLARSVPGVVAVRFADAP